MEEIIKSLYFKTTAAVFYAELGYDTMPENPLDYQEWPFEFFMAEKYVNAFRAHRIDGDEFKNKLDAYNKNKPDDEAVFQVYKYEHSGITFSSSSFNDRWDSGAVGLAVIKKEKLANFIAITEHWKDDAKILLEELLLKMADYYSGDIYRIDYHIVSMETYESDKTGSTIIQISLDHYESLYNFYGSEFKGDFDNIIIDTFNNYFKKQSDAEAVLIGDSLIPENIKKLL